MSPVIVSSSAAHQYHRNDRARKVGKESGVALARHLGLDPSGYGSESAHVEISSKDKVQGRHLRGEREPNYAKTPSSRKLQDFEGGIKDFEDVISSLADTSPMEWTGMQWLCLIILLMVVSTIFSCICGACCRRPRYGYGYGDGYGGGRRGGGGGCLSDIFWCFCCFEWCCRDCQDVDACCDAVAGSSAYQGMQA